MATSLPELKFRRFIEPLMREHWMMTWHEDREITPGVPDLHYVMKDSDPPGTQTGFRVGWLELKAIDSNVTPSQRFKIEPSQHQYIRRWHHHMPIHFMVRSIDDVFVIPGKYHTELASAVCLADVSILADLRFKDHEIAAKLPTFLRKITAI